METHFASSSVRDEMDLSQQIFPLTPLLDLEACHAEE